MVKAFAVSFLMLIAAVPDCIAQAYVTLPDSNATWSDYTRSFFSGNNSSYEVRQYLMIGDTTIGAYTYHKIAVQGGYQFNYGPVTYYYNNYVGAFRNDTVNRKVYYVIPNTTTDTLLYDFNITVGSPLPITYLEHYGYTVTSVDSLFFRGKWHKVYNTGMPLVSSGLYYQIIEGIGSTCGFLSDYQSSTQFNQLFCVANENAPVWPDTLTPCAIINGVHDGSAESESVNIFPVPAANELSMQFVSENPIERNIQLTDINGRVLDEYVSNELLVKIDLRGLENAVYFITIQSEGLEPVRRKIIVHNNE